MNTIHRCFIVACFLLTLITVQRTSAAEDFDYYHDQLLECYYAAEGDCLIEVADEAISSLDSLTKIELGTLHFMKAVGLYHTVDVENSFIEIQKALKLNQHYEYNLANMYIHLIHMNVGKFKKSVRYANMMVADESTRVIGLTFRSTILACMFHKEETLESTGKLLSIAPDLFMGHMAMGIYHMAFTNDIEAARISFIRALELFFMEDYQEPIMELYLLVMMIDIDMALNDTESAFLHISLLPEVDENKLHFPMKMELRTIDRVKESLEKYNKFPDRDETREQADKFFKNQQYEEALINYIILENYDSRDSEIVMQLARCSNELNQNLPTVFYYYKYLYLNPNAKDKKEVLARLSAIDN